MSNSEKSRSDTAKTEVTSEGAVKAPSDTSAMRERAHYHCSFCNKPHTEVRRLIAGPNKVYICDECVALCREIIEEKENDNSPERAAIQQAMRAKAILADARLAIQAIEQMMRLTQANAAFLPPELPDQLFQASIHVIKTVPSRLSETQSPSQDNNVVPDDAHPQDNTN